MTSLPSPQLESATFRISRDDRHELDDLASMSGLSRSDILRLALREGLPEVRRKLER